MTLTILLIAVVGGLAFLILRSVLAPRERKAAARPAELLERPQGVTGSTPVPSEDAPEYSTEAVEAALSECYKVAFGVARFDYHITGEHAAVLERVGANADTSVHQREYFPRRPLLLPRLMQVLNDDESTRRELVRLILEDPALAGSVLQRANSALYRYSPEPIDTLERAVVVLGTDGMRSLMATAILQPVFRQPKGYFENFATVTWEQARRSAIAAETYAKATQSADPFVAQLLGLVSALARIVLFRLTSETYREYPSLLPRAEVFIRAMQLHGPRVAGLIARTWELSDPSVAALQEQTDQLSPAAMTPLGRAVYFGELCGTLALLAARGDYSVEGAQAMLIQQGLARDTAFALWHAAIASEQTRTGTAGR